MWQERRASVRHPIQLPIRYRVLSERKQKDSRTPLSSHLLKTKDISDDGLLFLSAERFEEGSLLELTLPIRDKIFTLTGHVVYTSRDSESGLFRTGIHFSDTQSIFKVKMAEQLHQIDEYRKMLSSREGRAVSEEEAAQKWIDKNSDHFAEFYR